MFKVLFVLQGLHLAIPQILQAPRIRRQQLPRRYFIPTTGKIDCMKGMYNKYLFIFFVKATDSPDPITRNLTNPTRSVKVSEQALGLLTGIFLSNDSNLRHLVMRSKHLAASTNLSLEDFYPLQKPLSGWVRLIGFLVIELRYRWFNQDKKNCIINIMRNEPL